MIESSMIFSAVERLSFCISLMAKCSINAAAPTIYPQDVPFMVNITLNKHVCNVRCSEQATCDWFTYDMATDECWLFTNCPGFDTSCTSCVSDERHCPRNGKPSLENTKRPESTHQLFCTYFKTSPSWSSLPDTRPTVRRKS